MFLIVVKLLRHEGNKLVFLRSQVLRFLTPVFFIALKTLIHLVDRGVKTGEIVIELTNKEPIEVVFVTDVVAHSLPDTVYALLDIHQLLSHFKLEIGDFVNVILGSLYHLIRRLISVPILHLSL